EPRKEQQSFPGFRVEPIRLKSGSGERVVGFDVGRFVVFLGHLVEYDGVPRVLALLARHVVFTRPAPQAKLLDHVQFGGNATSSHDPYPRSHPVPLVLTESIAQGMRRTKVYSFSRSRQGSSRPPHRFFTLRSYFRRSLTRQALAPNCAGLAPRAD